MAPGIFQRTSHVFRIILQLQIRSRVNNITISFRKVIHDCHVRITIVFRMQPFVSSVNCKLHYVRKWLRTFDHMCNTMTAGKIPPSANDTRLCPEIMSLNHNEYNAMNAIRNYNHQISVVLCWNFRYQVFTARQMFTRLPYEVYVKSNETMCCANYVSVPN